MDNTTIEEKAKELYPDETGTFLEMPNQSKVILQRKAFIAGASLQTPNEKYWRERCEAAEELMAFARFPSKEEYSPEEEEKYYNWNQLKSTPIPILTPCVELEKEVERLKGENKDLIAYTEYVKRITDGGEWPMTYEAYK